MKFSMMSEDTGVMTLTSHHVFKERPEDFQAPWFHEHVIDVSVERKTNEFSLRFIIKLCPVSDNGKR
jgi:hypothetical protein